jgi:hypothetical protein
MSICCHAFFTISVFTELAPLSQLLIWLFGMFVQVDINHASEIDAIFDSISYDKGASVIRMLQSYLGAERFQVKSCSSFSLNEFTKILFSAMVQPPASPAASISALLN